MLSSNVKYNPTTIKVVDDRKQVFLETGVRVAMASSNAQTFLKAWMAKNNSHSLLRDGKLKSNWRIANTVPENYATI